MTVATFVQPNYLTQSASAYKAAIDAAIAVLNSIGGDFAPHASTAPNMQVVIDAGRIFKPGGTIVSVAQQTTGALIAPVSNPRIDRIVVDSEDGVYSVLTGTESASPVAPAIPNGKLPVCQISMTVGMTTIANSIITDERTTYGPLAKLLRMPVESVVAATTGFTREVLLVDRGILFDCDCSNGPIELLLPDSAQAGNGFMIGLIKSDATENRVTLTPSTTGETFMDGSLTKQVGAQNGAMILTTDGLGQWYPAFDSSRTYNDVTLTGNSTSETPSSGNNSSRIATTSFVYPHTINAIKGGAQSLTSGVGAAINFASDEHDSDNIHDTASLTSRFVMPTWATRAQFNAQVEIAANSSGLRYIQLFRNGGSTLDPDNSYTFHVYSELNAPSGTRNAILTFSSPILRVNASDYYEVFVYQDSGSNLNVLGSGGKTWFSAQILG